MPIDENADVHVYLAMQRRLRDLEIAALEARVAEVEQQLLIQTYLKPRAKRKRKNKLGASQANLSR